MGNQYNCNISLIRAEEYTIICHWQNSNKWYFVKKKVHMMMGLPGKLNIGIVGMGLWIHEYQKVKKVCQEKYQISILQFKF